MEAALCNLPATGKATAAKSTNIDSSTAAGMFTVVRTAPDAGLSVAAGSDQRQNRFHAGAYPYNNQLQQRRRLARAVRKHGP